MSNREKQTDEILALQAILETKFRFLHDPTQYEIFIDFDVVQPFYLRCHGEKTMIHSLPPISLIIHYHDAYPSDSPPSFLLSCFYFSQRALKQLCRKRDQYPFIKGEVCVYDWVALIQQEIGNELILETANNDKDTDDPRALNGYFAEDVDRIYQSLIGYSTEEEEKRLQRSMPTCLICTESLVSTQRIRLHRCGHTYCQACLNKYVQMALSNGPCKDTLVCPQVGCQNALRQNERKQITIQRAPESVNDASRFSYHSAVLQRHDNIGSTNEVYSRDDQKQRSEKQQEKDRRKLARKQEKARAESAQIDKHLRAAAERQLAQQTYREITIDLSEEDSLLEAILNAEQFEVMNTRSCPNCRVRIEKDGGCPAMQCAKCLHSFTWSKEEGVNEPRMASLLYHFPKYQSVAFIREELHKNLDTVKVSEEDGMVVINNRSFLGTAVVKRVKLCPNEMCGKLNVKMDDDNWIVCEECLEQYCFLCTKPIQGAQHFKKNCDRYTSF